MSLPLPHPADQSSSFRIRARLLSHDIRLNQWLEQVVTLPQPPAPAQALALLQPLAEQTMLRNLGEGCFYEILDLEIQPLD